MGVRGCCLGAVAIVAAAALGGCADKKVAPPAMTPMDVAKAKMGAPAGGDDSIDTGGLHIADAIARACGLTRSESSPKFEFDSAAIAAEDRELLVALAKCLSEGSLRGKSVALIGRADSRGEDEYNMTLGESRADSVRRYLHDLGVHPERLEATSRGEIDAIGSDEDGWAKDRRVDIELASR
jgi:peptidoglycan-associated lipoprotein